MSSQLSVAADELEALLPQPGADLDALRQSSLGGVLGLVSTLITALRSGDYNAALNALIALLQQFAGQSGNGGTIGFALQSAAPRFDWSKLIGILAKLLPLVLGA